MLSDHLPAELTEMLTGITLGNELVHIATIHTVRRRCRITEASGREPCAEVADDYVRASAGERLLAWREIEVELGARTPAPPSRLIKRLVAAGAQPSRYASKLAHVAAPATSAEADTPAARAVADDLTARIDQIVAGDIGLRRGQDPIHDTRVAIRRAQHAARVRQTAGPRRGRRDGRRTEVVRGGCSATFATVRCSSAGSVRRSTRCPTS